MNEAAQSPIKRLQRRERLRHGFFRQAWRELQDTLVLLESEGAADAAAHALSRIAERADSLSLDGVAQAVRAVVPKLGQQPARALLVPLGQVLRPPETNLFAPIAVVTGSRPYLLGPLAHGCEMLHPVESVEALRAEVWFDQVQAAIVPVKPRRSLQELSAEMPGRIWAWGPGGDLRKRETAVRDGAAGYFPVPLDPSAVLARVRAATERRLGPAPRVLLVSDTALLADPLVEALEAAGLGVWRANGLSEVVHLLEEGMPSGVIVAPPLAGGGVPDLAGIVRGYAHAQGVPLFLVGRPSRHGVQARDFDATFSAGSEPADTAAQVAALIERLGARPSVDLRTDLPNRAATLWRLDEEFVRAGRVRRPLAVAVVEPMLPPIVPAAGPDHDRAVRALGRALRVGFRAYDLVGSIGGDAILVALSDCTAARAAERLDAIQAGLERRFGADRMLAGLSLRAGVADSTVGLDSLLERVDRALGQARSRGEPGTLEADG